MMTDPPTPSIVVALVVFALVALLWTLLLLAGIGLWDLLS